jgi:hypothetical protein
MSFQWDRLPGTVNWQLIHVETGQSVRLVTVRGPCADEPGKTQFEVTGDAHELSLHETLKDAKTAAEQSLAPWERPNREPGL